MAKKKDNMTEVETFVQSLTEDLSKIDDIDLGKEIETAATGLDLLDAISGGGVPVGKLIKLTGAPGGGQQGSFKQ